MFNQLSSPGIRQVSHAPMPVGNIGQAVALQLLNNMYNNFDYESNQRDAVAIASPTGGLSQSGAAPPRPAITGITRAPVIAEISIPIAQPPRQPAPRPRPAITGITRAPVIAGISIPIAQPPRQPAPPPPPPVDYPPMGNGNALPLEPPTKPEDDQAAADEAAKKVKQKWTYIVLTIIVLIIIAYFYFRNRNKTN